MLSILLVLLPVALLLFSGILADRLRLIPSGGAAALNQFVFNISMPCLVFSSTALCSPEDLALSAYRSCAAGWCNCCFRAVCASSGPRPR